MLVNGENNKQNSEKECKRNGEEIVLNVNKNVGKPQ
jgi:hypothetical protein